MWKRIISSVAVFVLTFYGFVRSSDLGIGANAALMIILVLIALVVVTILTSVTILDTIRHPNQREPKSSLVTGLFSIPALSAVLIWKVLPNILIEVEFWIVIGLLALCGINFIHIVYTLLVRKII